MSGKNFSFRWRVFVFASLLFCIVAWVVNYSRPPVYRSQASLQGLILPINDRLAPASANQNLTQSRVLLSQPVLTAVVSQLKDQYPDQQWTVAELRALLKVEPVSESHVLNIYAEGDDPDVLSMIVNRVLDTYLAMRRDSENNDQRANIDALDAEVKGLAEQIKNQRQALENFRQEHDIVSIERQENAAVAKLNAQTSALNNAKEAMIEASAQVEAIKQAIASGKPVMPDKEQHDLRLLEERLQQLKNQLSEFDQRYTRKYLSLKPELRFIPDEINRLEKQIERKLKDGKRIVLAEAERNLEARRHTYSIIQSEFDKQRKEAQAFSSLFARYKVQEQDLAQLEKRYREDMEQLSHFKLSQTAPLPPARILDRALSDPAPIAPAYTRDALLTVPLSVVFGVFCVWLVDFLSPREQTKTYESVFVEPATAVEFTAGYSEPALTRVKPDHLLSSAMPYADLTDDEIFAMLSATHDLGRQVCALLLAGVSLEELPMLESAQFDQQTKRLQLPEPFARTLDLSPLFPIIFAEDHPFPPWPKGHVLTEMEFDNMVTMSALAAHLHGFERIAASCLRHNLIIALLAYGYTLTTVVQVVGQVNDKAMAYYQKIARNQPRKIAVNATLIHPAVIRFVHNNTSSDSS